MLGQGIPTPIPSPREGWKGNTHPRPLPKGGVEGRRVVVENG